MATIKQTKQQQAASKGLLVIPNKYHKDTFRVYSPTTDKNYIVILNYAEPGALCNCEWGKHRPAPDQRSACKHVIAVYRSLYNHLQVHSTIEQANRQHRRVLPIGDGVILTVSTSKNKEI